ncbi:MAG TPA: hypothetical protein VF691_20380 [Cytophagaceae bacterium]
MKLKLLYVLSLLSLASFKGLCEGPGRSSQMFADTSAPEHRVFLGLATGLNNGTGLFGVTCEVYLHKGLNAIGGLGLGSWGYKPMIGLRYYFDYPYRYAIGVSYSYATGTGNTPIPVDLQVIDTTGKAVRKQVPVLYQGLSLFNFTASKFWRIGKHHRFNIEAGYSVPLREGYAFRIASNDKVTRESIALLHFIQPGGIIISASFSFRL